MPFDALTAVVPATVDEAVGISIFVDPGCNGIERPTVIRVQVVGNRLLIKGSDKPLCTSNIICIGFVLHGFVVRAFGWGFGYDGGAGMMKVGDNG